MMRRTTWFLSGAVAGLASAGYAKKKVRDTAAQLAPVHVAKSAVIRVRVRGHDFADALREGRHAMRAKESELRARLNGTASSLADELDADDMVLVDGMPVAPGQVIVLRQVRDNEQVGPRRSSRRTRRSA